MVGASNGHDLEAVDNHNKKNVSASCQWILVCTVWCMLEASVRCSHGLPVSESSRTLGPWESRWMMSNEGQKSQIEFDRV